MNVKVAIVTGSSRGIGRAIALQLGREGFCVTVNYRQNQEQAAEVVKSIIASGGRAIAVQADVSGSAGADKLIAKTIEEYGQIDVLVNNAGINKDQLLLRISDAEWEQVINTNLGAAFYCSRAALKHMVRKRTGRIINISSVVGVTGNAGQAHYAAAKSGLLGFTFSIAQEYGRRGITANVVAPGYIQSDMTAALTSEQTASIAEKISAGRIGIPEDVAGVVAFLATPQAAYINGQLLRVDGGMASL